MTTLHLLARGPDADTLQQCRQLCTPGDSILLLEDGIYLAGRLLTVDPATQVPDCGAWYALAPHVRERGLADHLHGRVQLVDYDGFVRLAAEHARVVSWYR